MKRRAKSAAPYVDERGVPMVSVSTSLKRRVASACLALMKQRDGRDRFFLLRAANSIDVPSDILDAVEGRSGGVPEVSND